MGNLNDTALIVIGVSLIAVGATFGQPSLILAGANLLVLAADSGPDPISLAGRDLNIQSSVEPWRIIYGTQRVGGTYAFIHTTGLTNEYLNLIIILAGHEIESIDTMYFNGMPVPVDGTGSAITPPTVVVVGTGDEDLGTDIITTNTAHRYWQNMKVFAGGLPGVGFPDPLEFGQAYFIDVVDTTHVRLLDRYDGAVIDLTANSTSIWFLLPDQYRQYVDYTDFAIVEKYLGNPSQTASSSLITEVNDTNIWSTAHRLRGKAYVWVRLKWDDTIFPYGIPNITFDVQGKKIWDPVTTSEVYSNNAAMVLADYLTNTDYGVGIPLADIDDSSFIAARNICAEAVATIAGGTENRYDANGVISVNEIPGEVVRKILSSMGGQLVYSGGKYFIYTAAWRVPTTSLAEEDFREKLQIQPLTSRRDSFNAVKGVYISPENNWQASDYPTYNREIAQNFAPGDVDTTTELIHIPAHGFEIGDEIIFTSTGVLPSSSPVLTAGVPYWVWGVPTDDDFYVCNVRFGGFLTRLNFSSIGSGTHTVTADPYMNRDDTIRVYNEYALPFTISSSMAQRLAKILLERSRQATTLVSPARLQAFENVPPDVININVTRLDWVNKPFELVRGTLTVDENDGSVGYDMMLQETASEVFDWTTSEEKTLDFASNTLLPDPFVNNSVVTGLTLASGTVQLFTRLDGTIFSRIKVSWTAPADEFVLTGGHYKVEYKKNADSTWLQSTNIDGQLVEAFILDVEDGVAYDVRVRTVNSLGTKSSWVQSLNHTVLGKTVPPSDITTVAAAVNGETVTIVWTSVSDIDLAGYIIKYSSLGKLSWNDAILIADITRTTNYTTAVLPPGDWDVLVKAIDTSGNESVNFTSDEVTVSELGNVYRNIQHQPDWFGSDIAKGSTFVLDDTIWGLLDQDYNPITSTSVLTNFIRHPSGALVPEDQTLASGDNYDVFDNYVQNPEAASSYLGPIHTLPVEESLRIIVSYLIDTGPGEATNHVFTIEYRISNNNENWSSWISIKDLLVTKSFKRIQFRLTTTNTINEAVVVREYFSILDQPQIIKGGINISIPVEGLTIIFDRQFLELPRILITIADGGTKIGVHENAGLQSFDAFVYDITTGLATSGNIDWEAKNF